MSTSRQDCIFKTQPQFLSILSLLICKKKLQFRSSVKNVHKVIVFAKKNKVFVIVHTYYRGDALNGANDFLLLLAQTTIFVKCLPNERKPAGIFCFIDLFSAEFACTSRLDLTSTL